MHRRLRNMFQIYVCAEYSTIMKTEWVLSTSSRSLWRSFKFDDMALFDINCYLYSTLTSWLRIPENLNVFSVSEILPINIWQVVLFELSRCKDCHRQRWFQFSCLRWKLYCSHQLWFLLTLDKNRMFSRYESSFERDFIRIKKHSTSNIRCDGTL